MRCIYCDTLIKKKSFYSLFIKEDLLCIKCRKALKRKKKVRRIEGVKVITYYQYNSLFKSVILQYKECYDEALKDIFLWGLEDYLKIRYRGYQILYVPSSKEKLKKRGFNHLETIFKSLHLKELEGLNMIEELSQEGKSKKERLKMLDNYQYQGKKINKLLIVDDVLTSGSSIKGVLKVMKEYANKIVVIVLAN